MLAHTHEREHKINLPRREMLSQHAANDFCCKWQIHKLEIQNPRFGEAFFFPFETRTLRHTHTHVPKQFNSRAKTEIFRQIYADMVRERQTCFVKQNHTN